MKAKELAERLMEYPDLKYYLAGLTSPMGNAYHLPTLL